MSKKHPCLISKCRVQIIVVTLAITLQLLGCTPLDRNAMQQFNTNAPAFITLSTPDTDSRTKK